MRAIKLPVNQFKIPGKNESLRIMSAFDDRAFVLSFLASSFYSFCCSPAQFQIVVARCEDLYKTAKSAVLRRSEILHACFIFLFIFYGNLNLIIH